jgi:hypothetical protein
MLRKRKRIRILVAVPHYFDKLSIHENGYGSYESLNYKFRTEMIQNTFASLINSLSSLEMDSKVLVFGIDNQYLTTPSVKVDIENPKFLPWKALEEMYVHIEDFDYFLFLEDDIVVSPKLILELLALDSELDENETVVPNRIELHNGIPFCVDMIVMPGWSPEIISVKGKVLAMPCNVHSGVMFLSRRKFKRAFSSRKFIEPTIIIGDYMASALANIHSSLKVYRSIPTSSTLTVFHQDSWTKRMIQNGSYTKIVLEKLIKEADIAEEFILNNA